MVERINLECPSGIAANLFITSLITIGVPSEIITRVPEQLGLPREFSVIHDGYAYDGEYRPKQGVEPPTGTAASMQALVKEKFPDGLGERIAHLLDVRYRFDTHRIRPGESYCDTLFDATAAVVGLKYLGYPKVSIHSPLPITRNLHPVSHAILENWTWAPTEYEMELVTPTAAAILHEFATQTTKPAKGIGIPIQGAFTRRHSLPPMVVYLG